MGWLFSGSEADRWRIWKYINRKIWFIVVSILIIIPMVTPLGLPIVVESRVKDFQNSILALANGGTLNNGKTITPAPGGSAILMGMQLESIGYALAIRDWWVATFETLMQLHVKMVFVGIGQGGTVSAIWIMNYIKSVNPALYAAYPYGTSWVALPYLPGDETAMAQMASSLQTAYSADAYGTPLSQIPMMAQYRSLSDFQMTFCYYHIITYAEMFVRQWPAKYGVPMIVVGTFAMVAPYYGTFVTGCIESTQQQAEYEELTGILGLEIQKMDAYNLQAYFQLAMIFAGLGVSLYMLTQPKKRKVQGAMNISGRELGAKKE